MSFDEFIEFIRSTVPIGETPIVVAISGFGGSGKSTLAAKISKHVQSVSVVPIDDFIKGKRTDCSDDWSTFDRPRLILDILTKLRIGQKLCYRNINQENGPVEYPVGGVN